VPGVRVLPGRAKREVLSVVLIVHIASVHTMLQRDERCAIRVVFQSTQVGVLLQR